MFVISEGRVQMEEKEVIEERDGLTCVIGGRWIELEDSYEVNDVTRSSDSSLRGGTTAVGSERDG